MPIIVIIIIVIYILLISWVWQSMGEIEKTKKAAFILIGILVMFVITLVIFNISKMNVEYQNKESEKAVRNILVLLFTGVNSLIIMPYLSKLLNKVNENEIEKEMFSRKVIIILIIFIICIFFEGGYIKDTQKGILQVYTHQFEKGH